MSTTLTPAVPEATLSLMESFEGFSATPYRCPAGVWTIGFGSTRDITGSPVCATTSAVGRDSAALLARRDLMAAAKEVAQDVHVALTDNQKAALEDFIYNLGCGNFRASTLLRKLNAGDYAGAAAEFVKWDRAAGKELAGLLRRRQAETKLFTS
jgi:lysozyme